MKRITLLIGGDLVPTTSNINLFSNGEIKPLIGEELISLLRSVDFRIFNLEVPLTDLKNPIRKCGPNLIAPTSTIKGLKEFNPTVLCLANNHILDQDEQGLNQTIKLLIEHKINFVGAGKNLGKAVEPVYIEKEGLKIGIYACAEHEFTIAEKNRAGANPFDPLESLEHIQKMKAECDYAIVLYHGGKEHYRYPSPYLQKVCRKMVEKGADLIVCQHSHCIGSYETYNDKTIIYGQGNFLFDMSESEYWQTSMLIKASFGDRLEVEYIPILKNGSGVMLAKDSDYEQIMNAFDTRSKQILQPAFVETEYNDYCKINGEYYLRAIVGYGRFLNKIDRILKGRLMKKKLSRNRLTLFQNFIECETHRELMLDFLKRSEK